MRCCGHTMAILIDFPLSSEDLPQMRVGCRIVMPAGCWPTEMPGEVAHNFSPVLRGHHAACIDHGIGWPAVVLRREVAFSRRLTSACGLWPNGRWTEVHYVQR